MRKFAEKNTAFPHRPAQGLKAWAILFLGTVTVFPIEKGWFQHCVVDLKSYSDLLTVPILTKVILAEMNMEYRVSSNSIHVDNNPVYSKDLEE